MFQHFQVFNDEDDTQEDDNGDKITLTKRMFHPRRQRA